MSIRRAAAALLLFVATPALADQAEASLVAKVSYSGDWKELKTTFALVHKEKDKVVWESDGVFQERQGTASDYMINLGKGPWAADKDHKWCVMVDASKAQSPVRILEIKQKVDFESKAKEPKEENNIKGKKGKLCLTNMTTSAYIKGQK